MDLCQLPGLMTQASRLAKLEPARPQIRAASVAAVDSAGIQKLKVLYTVNIKMWRHPKYYKELRKLRNNLDQAISKEPATAGNQRSPDPGLKPQATSSQASSDKPQAPSNKRQAPSRKRQAHES